MVDLKKLLSCQASTTHHQVLFLRFSFLANTSIQTFPLWLVPQGNSFRNRCRFCSMLLVGRCKQPVLAHVHRLMPSPLGPDHNPQNLPIWRESESTKDNIIEMKWCGQTNILFERYRKRFSAFIQQQMYLHLPEWTSYRTIFRGSGLA